VPVGGILKVFALTRRFRAALSQRERV